MADERARWLGVADNRAQWQRLRRALELEAGFALFVVDVPDPGTEDRIVELLADGREALDVLDVRATGEQAPVRALLRGRDRVAVLRSVEASRRDIEALERCLVQLNARRDQIARRGHVLVIVLRRDAIERMLDVAPDLYSVHRARFRFARLTDPWPEPRWLITSAEYAALVDDDGGPFAERIEHYEGLLEGPIGMFAWPGDSGSWLRAPTSASEPTAARILAMREGLRGFADPDPPDLASMLASPVKVDEARLQQALNRAQSAEVEHVVALCRLGLAWQHLQRHELDGAREAAGGVTPDKPSLRARAELLRTCISAREGLVLGSRLDEFMEWPRDPGLLLDMNLTQCAILWEWQPGERAMALLEKLFFFLEDLRGNIWRHHTSLASLPSELLGLVTNKRDHERGLLWLGERVARNDYSWPGEWAVELMLARALDDQPRLQSLLELGRTWLATPKRRDVHEVWRPLAEIDASTLEQLARMPLGLDAPELFGTQLPAALLVVADLLDRGRIELSSGERDTLSTRAAARDGLSLAMRVGWWAIETALA